MKICSFLKLQLFPYSVVLYLYPKVGPCLNLLQLFSVFLEHSNSSEVFTAPFLCSKYFSSCDLFLAPLALCDYSELKSLNRILLPLVLHFILIRNVEHDPLNKKTPPFYGRNMKMRTFCLQDLLCSWKIGHHYLSRKTAIDLQTEKQMQKGYTRII